MRYTHHRGLAAVTRWVRLKFAAMNLKKLANWSWKNSLFLFIGIHFPHFYDKTPVFLKRKQGFFDRLTKQLIRKDGLFCFMQVRTIKRSVILSGGQSPKPKDLRTEWLLGRWQVRRSFDSLCLLRMTKKRLRCIIRSSRRGQCPTPYGFCHRTSTKQWTTVPRPWYNNLK